MSLLHDLRIEYRRLFAERNLIDVKISALEKLIAAYELTNEQAELLNWPYGYNITAYLKDVFAENGNKPMKLRAIIDKVLLRYPGFSETKAKNKIMLIVRHGALIQMAYGYYKFNMDLPVDNTDKLVLKPEDDPLFTSE